MPAANWLGRPPSGPGCAWRAARPHGPAIGVGDRHGDRPSRWVGLVPDSHAGRLVLSGGIPQKALCMSLTALGAFLVHRRFAWSSASMLMLPRW